MNDFIEPISAMRTRRTNQTLHGRSVHRPVDVPGHNVFNGYTTWANNGHIGVGDAVDLFGAAGEPVVALGDGVQTRWRNDTTRLEVIYLEGDGWLAVYAHIDARHEGENIPVHKGEPVGKLRSDLSDPHLHFEIWLGGSVVSAPSSGALRDLMLARLNLTQDVPAPSTPRLIVAKPAGEASSIDGLLYNELPSRWDEERDVIEVDTKALGDWLAKDASGLPSFEPIREALQRLGVAATFNLTHLGDPLQPRIYAFTS